MSYLAIALIVFSFNLVWFLNYGWAVMCDMYRYSRLNWLFVVTWVYLFWGIGNLIAFIFYIFNR